MRFNAMRTYKYLLIIVACMLALPAFSDVPTASDLIKVTKNNKANCVEYYIVKGTMYCTNKAFQSAQPVIPANNVASERQQLTFDSREWVAAWQQHSSSVTAVEYVVKGDNINSWEELITTQWMPNLQRKMSARQLAVLTLNGYKKRNESVRINNLDSTSSKDITFEIAILLPKAEIVHEVHRIYEALDGIYSVIYAKRTRDMGDKQRDAWAARLKQAAPKNK